jgi:hypothetical protein
LVLALAAPVPPCSSVLPPGAGNEEAKKAFKAQEERAKKIEGGYALEAEIAGDEHTATVRRHGDADSAAVPILEEAQATRLPWSTTWWVRAV